MTSALNENWKREYRTKDIYFKRKIKKKDIKKEKESLDEKKKKDW